MPGGSGVRKAFIDHTPEEWQSTVDLNLNSVVATMQAAARQFITQGEGGKLIVSSSIAALMGIPGGGYSATKAAVSGLIRSLAIELAPAGIQANAILPGFIETDMSLQTPQAFQDACLRRTASGKLGTLEDMEGVAVFLGIAAEQSSDGPFARHRWRAVDLPDVERPCGPDPTPVATPAGCGRNRP